MMQSTSSLALAGLLFSLPQALAGWNPSSQSNLVVYWGQNSANEQSTQSRLSTYCGGNGIDVIDIAFLDGIINTSINIANAGNNCTTFSDGLLNCPQVEEDIATCQSEGVTIIMSIGGATYTEGGFTSQSEAEQWADTVWAMFGPVQSGSSVNRPFGSAVVDGFDFDFESTVSNMQYFGAQLRSNMNAATGKTYYLSAAPQCPYPDAADGAMLAGAVSFDWIQIQFYNNPYCGANSYVQGTTTQNNYNFGTWDNWAHTASANANVKILAGVPGSPTAAGTGYVSGSQLSGLISYSKSFSSFAGAMSWDMSQVYNNPGFLSALVADLGASTGGSSPTTTAPAVSSTSTGSTPTTLSTVTHTSSSAPSSTTGLAQWAQCGGEGYTGPTQCAAPYSCVALSEWWSQCE